MKLEIAAADLRPLVQAVVAETLAATGGEKIAYDEAEAASLCSMAKWQLRDARLRGEIPARRVGKKYYYARAALVEYLRGETES